MRLTLKCGVEVVIRYAELQGGIAAIGTMYVVDFVADVIDKSCSWLSHTLSYAIDQYYSLKLTQYTDQVIG